MEKKKVRHSGAINGTSTNFLADRPKQVEDKDHLEYWEEDTRYYRMKDGKIFDADIYDKTFSREAAMGKVKAVKGQYDRASQNRTYKDILVKQKSKRK